MKTVKAPSAGNSISSAIKKWWLGGAAKSAGASAADSLMGKSKSSTGAKRIKAK